MEVQEEPLWSANFVEIVEKPHGEIGYCSLHHSSQQDRRGKGGGKNRQGVQVRGDGGLQEREIQDEPLWSANFVEIVESLTMTSATLSLHHSRRQRVTNNS